MTMKQYMTTNNLAAELGLSPETIRRWIREMRKLPDRYDEATFFGNGRTIIVRTVCLLDYSKYRDELQSPILRQYVPGLDAKSLEKKIGVQNGKSDI